MERTTVAVQVRQRRAVLRSIFVLLTLAQFQASNAAADDELVLALRQNVVRIAARWQNGASNDGFGFIIGEGGGFVYVATADHVVRSDGPDEIDHSPAVTFFQDQGTEHKSELLATRLRSFEGDLAVIRIRPPPNMTLTWRRDAIAANRVKRGAPAWYIGRQTDWFAPFRPGVVNRVEPSGAIIVEGLNIQVGTSGAPLISDAGIAGMVVVDAGALARVTPIEVIERAFKEWNHPWQVTAAPAPVQDCDHLAADSDDAGKGP
jgi:Trypsin-like peptidase domain